MIRFSPPPARTAVSWAVAQQCIGEALPGLWAVVSLLHAQLGRGRWAWAIGPAPQAGATARWRRERRTARRRERRTIYRNV